MTLNYSTRILVYLILANWPHVDLTDKLIFYEIVRGFLSIKKKNVKKKIN